MKNILLLSLSLLLSVFSSPAQEKAQAKPETPPPEETASSPGSESEVHETCFIMHDLASGEEKVGGKLCDTALSPGGTFEIPQTVIGLDSGVLKNPSQKFAWDGTPRARKTWDKEMDLAEAMKLSCVPCFQEMAKSIGAERMADYLGRFKYGNHDTSGGIDTFWLNSTLLITPHQQIDFLVKLYTGGLPVSAESQGMVRRLLIQRKGKDGTFSGKNGACQKEGSPPYGWFVGYAERGEKKVVFATLLRGKGAGGPAARKATLAFLQREGFLPKVEGKDKKPGKRGMVHQKKAGGKTNGNPEGDASGDTGEEPTEDNPR